MKQIDIIIPAYKAQDVIEQALASIFIQSFANECKVTIVNDADGIGYRKQIERFSDVLDIQEISAVDNGGPGVARQIGIDATDCPFIVFLDADDTFYNPFTLEMMYYSLAKYPESPLAIGDFVEIVYDPVLQFIPHKQDLIWMFGKMYRRSFLNQFDIRFNQTRANEDNGFNTTIQLCMLENNNVAVTIDEILYTWNFNRESITRKNDYEYTYNQSVSGYTENMIHALNHVKKYFDISVITVEKIIEIMINLYIMYMKTLEFKPQFNEQNWGHALRFYKEEFKEASKLVESLSFKQEIVKILNSKTSMMSDFIPQYTFYQFLERLQDEY